jgi:hypothetical protein
MSHSNNNNNNNHHHHHAPPSNEKLLCTAFISFQCFAVAQTIAAIIAGSEAMLGDSAASKYYYLFVFCSLLPLHIVYFVFLTVSVCFCFTYNNISVMVDAFTYLFNWYAERQKDIYSKKLKQQQERRRHNNNHNIRNIENDTDIGDDDDGASVTMMDDDHDDDPDYYSSSSTVRALEYKKYTYQLEFVPPLISVITLLIVTVFVLRTSIRMLILDSKRDVSLQADPNVSLMMLFSFLNLLLDIVNVGCFACAKHAFGYKTSIDNHNQTKNNDHDRNLTFDYNDDDDDNNNNHSYHDEGSNHHHHNNNNEDDGGCIIEIVDRQQHRVKNEETMNHHEGNGKIHTSYGDDDDINAEETYEATPMKPSEADASSSRHNDKQRHDGTHAGDNHDDEQPDDDDDEEEEESNLNMCSAYTVSFLERNLVDFCVNTNLI